MAAGDYRSCDVCGGKVFYDASLNYDFGPTTEWNEHVPPYRDAGSQQYADPDLLAKHGMRIDYLGDWAVICYGCAKTHRCVVQKIEDSHD